MAFSNRILHKRLELNFSSSLGFKGVFGEMAGIVINDKRTQKAEVPLCADPHILNQLGKTFVFLKWREIRI